MSQSQEVPATTPVCGPLPVQSTSNGSVVPKGASASIERAEDGTLYFCLPQLQGGCVPVKKVSWSTREDFGPWRTTSTELAKIGSTSYQVQVSVIFPGDALLERLYGVFVPVTVPAGGPMAEEPIVVWGSEDEGEGQDRRPG